MSDEVRAEIRQFITSKFPQISLEDQQDIFSLGFFNSLFAMELVMFIEKQFGVKIPNNELSIDNFRSVDNMTDLVRRVSTAAETPVA